MIRIGLLLTVLAGGCLAGSNKENLVDTLREYNNGLRWGRVDWMAPHVVPEKRGPYALSRGASDDLQVTGCEMEAVKLEGKEKARVTVRVNWYNLRKARLHTSQVEQIWKLKKSRWLLTEQRVIRGAPFPMFHSGGEQWDSPVAGSAAPAP